MEKKLDELLKKALAPTEDADESLNQKILKLAEEIQDMQNEQKYSRRILAAIFIAVLMAGVTSMAAYASWKYLSAQAVADEMKNAKLADVFLSEDAVLINESQRFGDYRVTLLGMVSGENLSQYYYFDGESNSPLMNRTYAVTAIENADETPLPDTADDAYGELDFFVSPLIKGLNPVYYNAASMHGGYTELWENGVLYRLVECDNVEIFADRGLYLCVSEGSFYNMKAYQYDGETGEISRNEEYMGLNALFELPVDADKADSEKAEEYLAAMGVEEPRVDSEAVGMDVDPSSLEIPNENEKGAAVVLYALQFVGNPYVWGESSLTEGTDSSGFVMSVYAQFDVVLPHSSGKQRKMGGVVDSIQNALPGDLFFYKDLHHVAIYLGDGQIIHAYPGNGICISEAEFAEVSEIRRIFE